LARNLLPVLVDATGLDIRMVSVVRRRFSPTDSILP